jgi:hypothetical protein
MIKASSWYKTIIKLNGFPHGMTNLMEELLSIIKDYAIEQDTEYAILIIGDWGCGKTFYWKNNISRMLLKLKANDDAYRPIYISLFGLTDVNEIIDKIAIQYYAPNFTKYALFSALRNSIQNRLKINNFKEVVHTLLNFNNIVVCFDDLERTAIPIKEILGYINSIIEHNKFKVVIICNDDEIKNDENEKRRDIYDKFKEKTIGVTYKYKPDYSNIISNLLASYEINNDFYHFLMSKEKIIYNIFIRSEKNNIRVLKHSLYNFIKIFYYLIAIDTNYLQKYGTAILIYLLVISFELLAKNPSDAKLKEIEAYANDDYNLLGTMMIERKEGTKIFNQEVQEIYYYDLTEYIYVSKAIYSYVIHGFFNVKDFMFELLDVEKSDNPEENYIKNLLSGYWKMSDEDFEKISSHILDNIKDGKIDSISVLNRLFLQYLVFIDKKVVDIEVNELIRIFKEGMQLSYSNNNLKFDSIDDGLSYLIDDKYLNDAGYQEINKLGQDIIEQNNDDIARVKYNKYFELFETNFRQFIEQLSSKRLEYVPYFKYIDQNNLFEKIIKLSNNDLIEFRNMIDRRNKIPGAGDRKREEKDALLAVKNKLDLYITGRGNKLSTHLYKALISVLDDIYKN